jgi:clostripain
VLEAEDSVDLMVFDVCLMSGVENAYQWSPRDTGTPGFSAQVMVATPMAGFPFPWQRIFARIGPGAAEEGSPARFDEHELSALDFGRLVVEETEADRRFEIEHGGHSARMIAMGQREAMACIDLTKIARVKLAADAFARELADWEDASIVLEELRGPEVQPRAVCYFLDLPCSEAPFFDLYELARRVADEGGSPEDLRARAQELAEAVDEAVVASYGLAAYDAFGGFQSGKHGLYVVYPYGLVEESSAYRPWAELGWYHPDDRREHSGQYGRYAWCRDGATAGDGRVDNWFEGLDSWFDLQDEAGGTNRYRY